MRSIKTWGALQWIFIAVIVLGGIALAGELIGRPPDQFKARHDVANAIDALRFNSDDNDGAKPIGHDLEIQGRCDQQTLRKILDQFEKLLDDAGFNRMYCAGAPSVVVRRPWR